VKSNFYIKGDPYDTIYYCKEQWLRFEAENQKISFIKFNNDENSLSDVPENYKVVSVSENEIFLDYLS
jgi:hypothetical protein